MNIYMACGLTHVPRDEFQSYARFIQGMAAHLEEMGISVKYALRESDPQLAEKPFEERARLCYLWDREMVEWADVVIAEASYPSTGLGIELQIADNADTPILICFEQVATHKAAPVDYETPDNLKHSLQLGEGFVSLMALGLPSIFKVIPYTDFTAAYASISDALKLLSHDNTNTKS